MNFFLPILSGILSALAFSSKETALLIFISLVPMFFVGIKHSLSKSVALFSFSFHLILMLWLFKLSSQTHPIIIFFMIIFIALGMMILYWIPFRIFSPKTSLGIIFAFILAECTPLFLGSLSFPWGRLGVVLAPIPEFIQTASILGSLGVSFVILAVNLSLAYFITKRKSKYFIIAILFIFLQYGYGALVLHFQETPSNTYKVAIIQGNKGSLSKWNTSLSDTVNHYLKLSDKAIESGAQLIIYPETAIPATLTTSLKEKFKNYAIAKDIDLVIGGYIQDGDLEYNALVNLENNSRYYKKMLVPVGEFLPFSRLLNYENTLGFGKESAPIETTFGKLGSMICYDSIFSNNMRDTVLSGAEILVISSNDSWFEFTPALYQHHAHGIMRAVEGRRYLIRSANSGISSMVSPYGEVLSTLPPYQENFLVEDVANSSTITPYVRLGDFLVIIGLCYLLYTKKS